MSSPATTRQPGPQHEPSDLAWRVIGLVNLYRLLISSGLFIVGRIQAASESLGVLHHDALLVFSLVYFAAGVALVLLRRNLWPGLRTLALTHVAVDALGIGALLWTCGGIASGFGILLVLPVGAMAMLAENRDAVLMAAISVLALLLQQIATQIQGAAGTAEYVVTGLLGAVLFLVSLSVRPLAHRLRESEAIVRRQELNLENMAQLSQYIVQHLRESILVVDAEDRIRLINESAASMLGDVLAVPGALLGEVSPRLLYLLATWRQSTAVNPAGEGTVAAADGTRLIQPHFAQLGTVGPGPVLIFLEDTGLVAAKVQQLKLAALGRLSASIAHEIRNPVGAMSHAGQLLAESPTVSDADRRLTEIIQTNGARVSRIIGNVLEFSRRGTSKPDRIKLVPWLDTFRRDFCATLQLPEGRLAIAAPADRDDFDELEVRVDPAQLQQVLWNLCQNALTHGGAAASLATIDLRYGRMAANARPFLEVADRGPGIADEDGERIFEPFFTTSTQGTGLGLFLARELAQTNGATLLHETRPGGGSLFRVVFSDPVRWET
jgi:two-component system sensor histidine kinase PilS (NtrC family)